MENLTKLEWMVGQILPALLEAEATYYCKDSDLANLTDDQTVDHAIEIAKLALKKIEENERNQNNT